MSAAVQHPSWCSPEECDIKVGGVHVGERLTFAPSGLGWSEDYPLEVYPTWAPAQGGYPAQDPSVYLYADGEGPLTAAEARAIAAMLVEAADAIERATTAHAAPPTLEDLLRPMLAKAGLSVPDIATATGIPQQRAAALLDGRGVWTVPELAGIAALVGCRASDLLSAAEDRVASVNVS